MSKIKSFYPKVQELIMKRTCDAYPYKLQIIQHKSLFLLPRKIALLLQTYPHLISVAVNAFTTNHNNIYDKKIKKYLTHLSYYKSSLHDMVAITIPHTRALHSQISFDTTFNSPRIFHECMKNILQQTKSSNKIAMNATNKITIVFSMTFDFYF